MLFKLFNRFFTDLMEANSVATRLKEIIYFLGLSDSQFADKCEISRATLSLLLSGKNKKVSDVLLSQIHNSFPEVSIVWLLFGEGEMIINQSVGNQSSLETPINLFEDQITNPSDQEEEEYTNLNTLNHIENIVKSAVNKSFDSILNNRFFSLKNESSDNNRRKVKQITVYYEDSTFETFLPES